MPPVLLLTIPFFAVCALGYIAARCGMLGDGAVRSLNIFAFYFAMPAMVAGALARQDIASVIDLRFLAGWLLAGFAAFAIGMVAGRVLTYGSLGQMTMMGQGSSVGNIGFLALPLLFLAIGENVAAGPMAMALIGDLVFLIPFALALLEADRGDGSIAGAIGRAAKGILVNPFIVAIAIGLTLSLTGIGLPPVLDRFSDFLGGAAGPAGLFALGASLAGRRLSGDMAGIGAIVFLKLVAHPLLVWLLLGVVLGIDVHLTAITVVIAAMPVASNVFVIAEQYGILVRRASAAVFGSTVLAVATVALALRLVV